MQGLRKAELQATIQGCFRSKRGATLGNVLSRARGLGAGAVGAILPPV